MLQWIRSLAYTLLLFACTMAFGVVVLVSALLSGLAVRRRLDNLDLIAVLKAAESPGVSL